jgi:cold shock CspA family protein
MFGFKGGKAAGKSAGKTGAPAAFGGASLVLPAARPSAHFQPAIAPGRVAMPQAASLVIPGKGMVRSVTPSMQSADAWQSSGSMNLGAQAAPATKGKGKGKISLKIAMGEPAFVGKLRRFDAEKGSGFIACAEVYAMCHAEVYAFKPILESQGIGVGDTIVFFVHWNAKGKPQATYELLRIATAVPGQYAMKGIYKASADPSKGFGFIEAPLAHEFFQRDVYVSKEQAALLQPNQTVAFNVKLNKDLQPSAADLVPVDPMWEPLKGDLSQTLEDTSLPPPWECSLVTAPKKGAVKATGTGELFLGLIKAFNERMDGALSQVMHWLQGSLRIFSSTTRNSYHCRARQQVP